MSEHSTEQPHNLDEMAVEFFELEEIAIAEWGEGRDGQGPQTQVHMLLTMANEPTCKCVVRFKGPDTLAKVINALIFHGINVFGRTLTARLQRRGDSA